MAKFDMAAIMGSKVVSELDTVGDTKIEYIDIDLIDTNDANFYAIEDLGALADSILLDGLQQPLVVTTSAVNAERVLLLSGHRRRAAIASLVDDAKNPQPQLRKVPCIRKHYASPAMAELQLILANSTARKLSSADIMRQATRLEELFYQLKEVDGYEFPGRMRDQVAAACQVSATKLARLKVIRDGLVPAYMEQFSAGTLSEQTAYLLAGLPTDFQVRCARVVKGSILGHSVDAVKGAVENGATYEPTLTCPDGSACGHGDAFLRHDMKGASWNLCHGKKCCLDCREAMVEYGRCDHACSKAKKKWQAAKDSEKAKSQKEADKRRSKAQKYAEEAAEFFVRMKCVAEEVGIPFTADFIESFWVGYTPTGLIMTLISGAYEASQYDDARTKLPTAAALVRFCHKTGCSADYVLGLSDKMTAEGRDTEDG